MQNNQFSSIHMILTLIIYLCFHDTGIILGMVLCEQALVWLIRAIIICLFSCVISSVSYHIASYKDQIYFDVLILFDFIFIYFRN